MTQVASKQLKINHAAVIVATLLYQVLMMGWYTLFSEQWVSLQGKTEADFDNGDVTPFIVAFFTALIMYYVLAWLFVRLNVRDIIEGLKVSFIIGFGIYTLQLTTQYLFSMLPIGLALIDGGGSLLTFLIAGPVLGGWKKYEN
jgi:hypothetical protein